MGEHFWKNKDCKSFKDSQMFGLSHSRVFPTEMEETTGETWLVMLCMTHNRTSKRESNCATTYWSLPTGHGQCQEKSLTLLLPLGFSAITQGSVETVRPPQVAHFGDKLRFPIGVKGMNFPITGDKRPNLMLCPPDSCG